MGAVQILTHSMVQSIEENSVRKGFDPRDFALVAEGAPGRCSRPRSLEVGTPMLVPPYGGDGRDGPPGHRHGLRVRHHHVPAPLMLDAPALQRSFEDLEEKARVQLEEDGVLADRILIQRIAECRYVGQGYELRVDAESGMIDSDWAARLRSDFDDIHEREYSRRFEDADVEVPNVGSRGSADALETPEVDHGGRAADEALRREGEAWFRVDGLRPVATRYYDRAGPRGNRTEGPAIVLGSTTRPRSSRRRGRPHRGTS